MSETISLDSATRETRRTAGNLDLESLLAIERQVQRFRETRPCQPAKIDLKQYLDCLPTELHETATIELLLEVLQQQHQDRLELVSSCKERLDDELIKAVLGGTISAETLASESELPQINGYQLVEIIGKGGTAVVFKAIQHNPSRMVAIKIPIHYDNGFDRATLRRFYSEARLQSKYLGSGVPAVFEFGMTNEGVPFISMELVEGSSFESSFRSDCVTFDAQRDGIRLIAKICRALAPIHADGNSHLDLSPANVFVKPDGLVKILDFGFGQDSSQSHHRLEAAGTPCYMAPEKARGDLSNFSTRSDVFSIGAFLARMITSEQLLPSSMPNDEKLKRIAAGDFAAARERVHQAHKERGVPLQLIDLTIECLCTLPMDRPRDASVIAERIENYFRSEERELHRLQVESATQRARSQIMIPAFATVLGVLLVGTIVSVRYAMLANAEKQVARTESVRAARNAELRLAALDDVVLLVADDSLRRAGQTRLQRHLLERLRPRIEDVLAIEDDDEATKQQQGLAWNSLSVIHQVMHESTEAQAAAKKAEAILRELCQKPDASTTSRIGLATALGNLIMMLGQAGKLDEAIAKAEEATGRFKELMADKANGSDANIFFRASLAECNWGNCLLRSGSLDEVVSHYLNGIEHIETATKIRPKEVVYRAWQAKLFSNLADLYRTTKNAEKAAFYGEESLRVAKQLKDDFPTDIDTRECLAVCLTNVGLQRLEGENPIGSLPLFEESLKLYSALSTQVPEYGEFAWGRAMSESNVGAAMLAGPSSGLADAKRHLDEAAKLYGELQKSMPDSAELKLYIDENNTRIEQLNAKQAANP